MRRFATSARAFLKIVWDGMKKGPFWGEQTEDSDRGQRQACRNPEGEGECSLESGVWTNMTRRGKPHTSSDPKEHIAASLYKDDKRVTSVHVYADGTAEYSKEKYNK
ncbi:hypothetical protein LTR09_009583 [Extremus antarcticus]|uniref:Uncharacterized protein n=1 Tax=Extremus antarcticus TaxID=702011 RepID=A0AAJ0D8W3_9PEZI|nr:hypothetical protein LTR09_009583 [Extremus antarcticus]